MLLNVFNHKKMRQALQSRVLLNQNIKWQFYIFDDPTFNIFELDIMSYDGNTA